MEKSPDNLSGLLRRKRAAPAAAPAQPAPSEPAAPAVPTEEASPAAPAGRLIDRAGCKGMVVGGAMVLNLIAAGLAGVGIPLMVEKVGGDPAVISGVFVTTVTDCVGFFAVLGLATWWYGVG